MRPPYQDEHDNRKHQHMREDTAAYHGDHHSKCLGNADHISIVVIFNMVDLFIAFGPSPFTLLYLIFFTDWVDAVAYSHFIEVLLTSEPKKHISKEEPARNWHHKTNSSKQPAEMSFIKVNQTADNCSYAFA